MPEFDAPIQKQSGGGEVADLGVGAGFMAGIGEMKSGAEGMLTAAKSGGFRSDPEGVKQMVKICQEMFDHLERKSELFTSLAQEPKLGTSPYAKQVARHVASSGDGPQPSRCRAATEGISDDSHQAHRGPTTCFWSV